MNGGLEKWNKEKLVTTNIKTDLVKTKYSAIENKEMVKNLDEINDNIEEKKNNTHLDIFASSLKIFKQNYIYSYKYWLSTCFL